MAPGLVSLNARRSTVKSKRLLSKAEDRAAKRKTEEEYLATIRDAINKLDPKDIARFDDLPLTDATRRGLRVSHFETPTDIQKEAILLALKGRDVLGAARTGSGKTLAFLIPLLECLKHARWTELDSLGAVVISPTRELAVQTFEVLRKIGRYHTFSAGLLIGGKSLEEEAARLFKMNILVATPGRLLQHLDQTSGFQVENLQLLVLDEADRLMDLGFQHDIDALVEHLPKTRQTLLFSATQSKKVSDLARLSLKDAEYVNVHEIATPSTLQHHYVVVPLPEKLETLWGFLKSNVKAKIIVFLSSGKQVRFVYEMFKRMQPGISLLHLHGRQKQVARLEVTSRFSAAKHACLLATDVAARGLDFPAVDWVLQVDAPESADDYIHRSGRTARFNANGKAIMFLEPREEDAMVKRLEAKRIPISRVNVKEKKRKSIKDEVQKFIFQESNLKYLAQKAFISYVRSVVYLQNNVDLETLDLEAFAASLGLPGAPQIKSQKGQDIKKLKNASRQAAMLGNSESDGGDGGLGGPQGKEGKTKYDKMAGRTNQDVLSSHYRKLMDDGGGSDEDGDDFLIAKRTLLNDDLEGAGHGVPQDGSAPKLIQLGGQALVIDSNRRAKLLQSKKKLLKYKGRGTKLVFDDEGNAHPVYELQDEEQFRQQGPPEQLRKEFVTKESERVREADVDDKQAAKQKRKEKRERKKARKRGEELEKQGTNVSGAQLATAEDEAEDPLALLRSLPTWDNDDRGGEDGPPRKRARKWFQKDADDEVPAKRGEVMGVDQDPDSLEGLEALATGLLNP